MGLYSVLSTRIAHIQKNAKIGLMLFLLALLCASMLYFPSLYNESFTLAEWILLIVIIFVVSIALIIPEILYVCLPVKMLWGRWEQTDNIIDQKSRMLCALADELALTHMSKVFRSARYRGQAGHIYSTTLNECTCEDFLQRKVPCEHMYQLAITLGAVVPLNDIKDYASTVYQNQGINNKHVDTANQNQSLYDSNSAINFEMSHESQIKKYYRRIEKTEDKIYDTSDPDETIKYYHAAIKLHQEFKDFCFSESGGKDFYLYDDGEEKLNDIQKELNEYMEDDYEIAVAYREQMAYQKNMEDKIIKIIADNNGCLQKNIHPLFPPDEKNTVNSCIERLVSQNRLIKQKQGSLNFLIINETMRAAL